MRQHIGVLGGTFDPVHRGHLRMAVELVERLQFDKLLLVPVGTPPHRTLPQASAAQRLAMLHLAIDGKPRLAVDDRECRKSTVAYTFDTLGELRAERGAQCAISFCVGSDAFLGMHRWRRWRELPGLAHIVVMSRPGWDVPQVLGDLEGWRHRFCLSAGYGQAPAGSDSAPQRLRQAASGRIVFPSLTPVDISATRVRRRVAAGQSPRLLVPDAVWRYIQRNALYQAADSAAPTSDPA